MMKKLIATSLGLALFAIAGNAEAQITIDNLDVRGTGIFGSGSDNFDDGTMMPDGRWQAHTTNVSGASLNGGAFPGGPRNAADPIDVALTYSNLDLDDDGTANDAVTFTMR